MELSGIRFFVLDLDGTFYLGDHIYDFSLDFLRKVEETGRQYLFFTNNSSRSPMDYVKRLNGMGCSITRRQVMTSGDVMIAYLKKYYPGKSVYLLGTPALQESFREEGIALFDPWDSRRPQPDTIAAQDKARPDIVVVGYDKTLTYEKLVHACDYIRDGAVYLATHPDINCPVPGGFEPDCGAMCALISLSTGREPLVLGKPAAQTAEMVVDATGFAPEQVAFVGDRLYTDVATGVKNGCKGFLVLSGEATMADVEASDVKPDYIFRDLGEIAEHL